MLRINLIRRLVCAFLFTIVLGVGHAVSADPIGPGFDLFATVPGTFADIPGIGIVMFMGGPPLLPETNVDTIVQRLQGINPFPVGGVGTIPIVLRELSLQSVAPVNIGGTLFNVFATALPAQTSGTMTVFHTTVEGGTFNSILPVDALLTFMPVGEGMSFTAMFSMTLTSVDCQWSHTPPPNYPTPPQFPSGGFFPIGRCFETSPNEEHVVEPAQTPEPATLLLLASGIAGIAGVGRKRISRRK